jgi:hypothetical protein
MVNHPNRSKHAMKPGTHDLGQGWKVEYLPARHSGSRETMTFWNAGRDGHAGGPIILESDSIALLRQAMKLA